MTPEIGLVARARGLAAHLVGRDALEALCQAPDLPSFSRELARGGLRVEPVADAGDIASVEQAVRRTAARHLRVLTPWREAVPGLLDLFFAAQDRRSLRALLRGAVQGAPAEARLAGLLSTPELPERALTLLAHQASPRAVAAQLVLLGHPDATRLLPLTAKAQPELFSLDVALLRGFAERAGGAARAADALVQAWVAELLDLGNVQDALLFVGGPRDTEPGPAFIEGGRWLPREAFLSIARAPSRPAALGLVREALARSPLASLFPTGSDDGARADRAFLVAWLGRARREGRLDPLGSAPVLEFLLRLEAQSHDLRAVAWGAVLQAPPVMRKQELVTPWS